MDYSAFEAGSLTEYFRSALKLGSATFHKNNSYILNAEFTNWFVDIPEIRDKTHIMVLIGDARSRLVSWFNFHSANKQRTIDSGGQLSGFLQSLNTDTIEDYYNSFAKYGLSYSDHLNRLVKTFGADHVHVISQSDLLEHPHETIGALSNKLGFSLTNTSLRFNANSSAENEKIRQIDVINEELIERLRDHDIKTQNFCSEHTLRVTPLSSIDLVNRLNVSTQPGEIESFKLKTVNLKESKEQTKGNVLVVGNGPSAALVNFEVIDRIGLHTVGMNSAYRLWDRISFRPTYYACLDSVVVISHADAIYSLVKEEKIERFLLRDDILEKHPDLKANPRITWFSDVYNDSSQTLFTTDWITTGSWSIRWMAYLGYQLIGCVGIDAKYQQVLNEATLKKDSTLEITTTPSYNPNYFFDDYQVQGDVYNIPNDPAYMALQGGTVHQDALIQAKQDIDVFKPSSLIVDCSPIANHGAFQKCSINNFYSHASTILVTTFFYRSGSEAEFSLNMSALDQNLAVRQLSRIIVLFEGDFHEALNRVEPKRYNAISNSVSTGRLQIVPIDSRPNYHLILSAALKHPSSLTVVANSDIVFDGNSISNIISYKSKVSSQTVLALTRWNITDTGVYPQGQVPTPPWQEKHLSEVETLADINYLSYDTYVYDSGMIDSQSLSHIHVGTFGCDTAIAAILRISGINVVNPCITLKTHHIDNKPRNYSSESGTKQVVHNVNSFYTLFKELYHTVYGSNEDLALMSSIDRSILSIGMPRPPKHLSDIGWEYALLRLFGFTPWSTISNSNKIEIDTFDIDATGVIENPDDLARSIQDSIVAGRFIEFNVTGNPLSSDYLSCFLQDYNLELVRKELFRYDRQTVCSLDLVSKEERRAYDRVMMLIKDIMNSGAYSNALSLFCSNGGGRYSYNALRSSILTCSTNGWPIKPLKHDECPSSASRTKYRLLVIDPTPIGSRSATGQVKLSMFGFIDQSMILQIWEHDGEDPGFRLYSSVNSSSPHEIPPSVTEAEVINAAVNFKPTHIYFRSTKSERLHLSHQKLIKLLGVPSIIHIMDDWLSRLRKLNPLDFAKYDAMLRESIRISSIQLAISSKMAKEYSTKFGGHWAPVANAVDEVFYDEALLKLNNPEPNRGSCIRFCYMGGLAADMNTQSVHAIAKALTELRSSGIETELHVYTMPWYMDWASSELLCYEAVSLHELVEHDDYMNVLSTYDASIIAYNFDEITKEYTSLSMANKLPEILASGAYLFAYGPYSHATIEYITDNKLGTTVTSDDHGQLLADLSETIKGLEDSSLLPRHQSAIRYARIRHSRKLLHSRIRHYLDLASHS